MSRHAVLVAAALAAIAGCHKHATETIIVVQTEGVRIPQDVHKVHLTVQDRTGPAMGDMGAPDETVYEQDVELCREGLSTACYDIPVSAVLFPGKARGTDPVRVQVDAVGGNGVVISNAALFTFADDQTLRLDFVLYANCLGNVECAKRDQACGPLDTCIDLTPTHGSGATDLARPMPPADLATPTVRDMTVVDLAGVDLYMPPPDLTRVTIDMAGCPTTCPMGEVCVGGTCTPCGGPNQLCCPGFAPPPSGCNATNLVCDGTYCRYCGAIGELCCMGGTCPASGFCNPPSNMCEDFPDFSMPTPPKDMGIMMSLD
jgi:hypothetical protein